ncbi:hypothetical protein FFLO_00935 [Filobasidium floriforme]|uniref:Ca3427-like PBP 2 domain-containing protein n=1 Tax=Filobasidium floriforme TaxID=5210 RepID=A0A8K0JQJ7_9TREE|nr:hypothetical protein FFLO_00935 [Filobasidium floriforme]
MVLKVGWHREHFLSPLLQLHAAKGGFELVECPGGTGDMQAKLKAGEIDVCIALTDALIAGIANGQTSYKIVGRYISTPLRWAIITGKDSQYQDVSDLKGTKLGISRLGSGSQVMASVMALREKWSQADQPTFEVKGSFQPLRDSVNSGETSVFLWEWFTTKPYADSGEVRFIGSVYTPWPCWMIAASPAADADQVSQLLTALGEYTTEFDSKSKRESENVGYVAKTFGQREEDVKEWLGTVAWYHDLLAVERKVVTDTLEVLGQAGVVKRPSEGWDVDAFVDQRIAKVI